jgi:hypothetical protein
MWNPFRNHQFTTVLAKFGSKIEGLEGRCPGGKMLVRKLSVVAISAALLIGATGCSITSNVATKKVYAPSDGTQADAGSIHARNVLVLSDGTNAHLIGSIVNDGETDATATLTVGGGATAAPTTLEVKAGTKVDFGYPAALGFEGSQPAIELTGTIPAVGSNIQVTLNNSDTAVMDVQVLDGTVPTYADLMPFLKDVATPEATPAPTATN